MNVLKLQKEIEKGKKQAMSCLFAIILGLSKDEKGDISSQEWFQKFLIDPSFSIQYIERAFDIMPKHLKLYLADYLKQKRKEAIDYMASLDTKQTNEQFQIIDQELPNV